MKYLFPIILLVGCGAGESVISEIPDASDEPEVSLTDAAQVKDVDSVSDVTTKDSSDSSEKDSGDCRTDYENCLKACDKLSCDDKDKCIDACEKDLDKRWLSFECYHPCQ